MTPNHTDKEIRIRLLERLIERVDMRFEQVDRRFEHLESKIDTNFHWTLGWTLGAMVTLCGAMMTLVFILHA